MILELNATPADVMRAVEALQEFGRKQNLAEKDLFGLALALEECGSNIVHHAYRGDANRKFQVRIERLGSVVAVELRDHGPQFDPTCAPPRTSAAHDELPAGGWGIQLARNYVDEMRYRREAGENILRLAKLLGHKPTSDDSSKSVTNSCVCYPESPCSMPLEIKILKEVGSEKGVTVVKLGGSLDTATAPELERQLAPLLGTGIAELVFDLGELRFVSSAGLRVFSIARKKLKERGGQASFVHLQPQIQEVFDIIQALPGVAIFKDVAELDRYLLARQRSHTDPA